MLELTNAEIVGSIAVLVLSMFLGFELISKVPPTLHTPLMSGSNAISGITVIGALVAASKAHAAGHTKSAAIIGFVALVLATVNVVAGFAVTQRMLRMFKSK